MITSIFFIIPIHLTIFISACKWSYMMAFSYFYVFDDVTNDAKIWIYITSAWKPFQEQKPVSTWYKNVFVVSGLILFEQKTSSIFFRGKCCVVFCSVQVFILMKAAVDCSNIYWKDQSWSWYSKTVMGFIMDNEMILYSI